MGRSPSLTPTIIHFANRAKQLKEWTRFTVFEGDPRNKGETPIRNSDAVRNDINRRIDQIAREQKALNKFYKNLGLPALSNNHPVVLDWERRLTHMRKSAKKGDRQKPSRKKRSSAFPSTVTDETKIATQSEAQSNAVNGNCIRISKKRATETDSASIRKNSELLGVSKALKSKRPETEGSRVSSNEKVDGCVVSEETKTRRSAARRAKRGDWLS